MRTQTDHVADLHNDTLVEQTVAHSNSFDQFAGEREGGKAPSRGEQSEPRMTRAQWIPQRKHTALSDLVGPPGLEPGTYGLKVRSSTN